MPLRQRLHRLGYDLHRFDPDSSIDAYLATLLPHLDVDCVFDVGANTGQFAEGLRTWGYRGAIHSFEPIAASHRRLAMLALYDRHGWEAHHTALGSQAGTATMILPPAANMASFRRLKQDTPDSLRGNGVDASEPVAVARLADLGPTLTTSQRVFLKLDTQGWDLEVLAGAGAFLDQVVAMQSEVSILPLYDGAPTLAESLARFAELGFAPSAFFKICRDEQLRLREVDCVLVRHEHPTAPPR